MKKILLLSMAFVLTFSTLSCLAQESKKIDNQTTAKVEVYYFHFTRRCSTCMSVEENAKQALALLYADKVKAGEYSFTGLNLDDASSKQIAERFDIGGQTLLVVKGDKKVDITAMGFMNAHDVDKMKAEIKKAIDSL